MEARVVQDADARVAGPTSQREQGSRAAGSGSAPAPANSNATPQQRADAMSQRRADAAVHDEENDVMRETAVLVQSFGHEGAHVSEVLCPGRFTSRAATVGPTPGHAFDVTLAGENGELWDLSDPENPRKREAVVDPDTPYL